MYYVKTRTRFYSDSSLPTPCLSLSDSRGHRPKSGVLETAIKAPHSQQPLATTPQPDFRTYGRGCAGSRHSTVKPTKSELDTKEKSKFPGFTFPAKWRRKVSTSEPIGLGFYDMPWCGPSPSPQSSLSPSPSSPAAPIRWPFGKSTMFAQRNLFLASIWKKNLKRMGTSNANSFISVTRSTLSSSASSLVSLSRHEAGDDSANEMYAESFEFCLEPPGNPPFVSYTVERVVICREAGAASEDTSLENESPTTQITIVGMDGECDVLDAMRKLRIR
ncbi:uncharacterized protein BT62DRAFT_604229 [Guyanagaster necrorhizus]|uniref:Uncharacterized protein n=1 Tax=Guyanagaster necrorhizus TaxID=856835 RepID=A0A9P7VY65_9AGAR|nr:uncharacterized protein BT62DRAFT_604229 [Guyanagaster necrorhizus MCA 3950]KAG7449731.1 hypothetical protein BT62DRAFT_604229 [Guyanagaster necrorhizus MCA 3950]